jgi:PilZ domain-containing protein
VSEAKTCAVPGCNRQALAELEGSALCFEHFISTSYARLDRCLQVLDERPFRDSSSELVRKFIQECADQASNIARNVRSLENLEKARLLDVLLRAADLMRHLRRSQRKIASIPVRLRNAQRGWEEEAETRQISENGASLECGHALGVGEELFVVRPEADRRARARVVWCERKGAERCEFGIEFVNCEDFWEPDWSAIGTRG